MSTSLHITQETLPRERGCGLTRERASPLFFWLEQPRHKHTLRGIYKGAISYHHSRTT
jgi:hypothetical protein